MKDLFVKCYTYTQEKALLAAIKLLTGMSLFGVYYIIIIWRIAVVAKNLCHVQTVDITVVNISEPTDWT